MDITQTAMAQSTHSLASAKTSSAIGNIKNASLSEQKAEAAAKEFEAVYISQMLTHMFSGIETDGMFGGGNAENIYQSMMIDEYGKLLSRNGGIGLSGAVKSEIIALQSKHNVTLGELQNDQ